MEHDFASIVNNGIIEDVKKIQEQHKEQELCIWCHQKKFNRFECSLIDENGSDMVINHEVITCIADYCPKCGRKL